MKDKLYEYTLFLIYCQKMHFIFILFEFTRFFSFISYICECQGLRLFSYKNKFLN